MSGGASREQDWSLDALGNWDSVTDETSTSQTRTHDDQNRITSVSSATTPTHSANGEMTGDETGQVLAYDAWGRLVEADPTSTSGDEIAYAYDALYRRIKADGVANYYSADWQVLEERDASTGDVQTRNVWSPVYVDAMVLRDRDTDADGRVESTSAGDERLYMLQDANFNVTAVAW